MRYFSLRLLILKCRRTRKKSLSFILFSTDSIKLNQTFSPGNKLESILNIFRQKLPLFFLFSLNTITGRIRKSAIKCLQEKASNVIWASVTLAGAGGAYCKCRFNNNKCFALDCDCLSGGKYLLKTLDMAFARLQISKFSCRGRLLLFSSHLLQNLPRNIYIKQMNNH